MAAEAATRRPATANKAKPTESPRDVKSQSMTEKSGKWPIIGNTLLVVVILLLAFCSAVYLDLFHVRASLIGVLYSGQSPYQAEIDFLAMRQQEMAQQEIILLDTQWNQEEFQIGLDKREVKLMEWEDTLNDRENALVEQQQWLDAGSSDMKTMAVTYEKMDAATAARILSAMEDINYVKQLLAQMKQASVAAILSKMDPALASQITVEMLQATPVPEENDPSQ